MNRSLTSAQIYDGEFFDIVGCENDILIVRCNVCSPDGSEAQLLRTSVKSNGNILKHIKRRHPELMEQIKETKCVKTRAPRVKMESVTLEHGKWGSTPKLKKGAGGGDDTDGEDRLMLLPEEYVVEPIDASESDQEEYVTYELESTHRGDGDHSIEVLDESQLDGGEYEVVRRAVPSARKRPHEPSLLDQSPMLKRTAHDTGLVDFQKKLMQLEYEEMRKLRAEKHALEISILKADLAHKTMEHQKRMEVLSKKLNGNT